PWHRRTLLDARPKTWRRPFWPLSSWSKGAAAKPKPWSPTCVVRRTRPRPDASWKRRNCATRAPRSFPILRHLRRHDVLVGHVALENADIAGELIHAGDELARDRGIVVRQVAADELGDQLGLRRRKELLADRGGTRDLRLQRRMRLHHRAHRGGRRLRRFRNQRLGGG